MSPKSDSLSHIFRTIPGPIGISMKVLPSKIFFVFIFFWVFVSQIINDPFTNVNDIQIYICIYKYTYTDIYIYIYIYARVCVSVCMYVATHTCIYIYISLSRVCVCIYIYICIFVCVSFILVNWSLMI